MMEFLRKPIVLIVVAIIGAVILFWSTFDRKEDTSSQDNSSESEEVEIVNLTNLEPKDFDSIIRTEYAKANEEAKKINGNYTLAAIEIEIGQNLTQDEVLSRYIFITSKDTENNWVYTVSQTTASYIRALIPKSDYFGSTTEMNTKLWQYNYVTALQLAEKNGGQDFREDNDITGIKLTLRHYGDNNWLMWIVRYDSESTNKTIYLDASSGDVLNLEE